MQLQVKNLQFEDGKMIPASKYFSSEETASLDLTDDEKKMAEEIRVCVCLCASEMHYGIYLSNYIICLLFHTNLGDLERYSE